MSEFHLRRLSDHARIGAQGCSTRTSHSGAILCSEASLDFVHTGRNPTLLRHKAPKLHSSSPLAPAFPPPSCSWGTFPLQPSVPHTSLYLFSLGMLIVLRRGANGSSRKPSLHLGGAQQAPAEALTLLSPPAPLCLLLMHPMHQWAVIYLFTHLAPPLDYEFLKGRDVVLFIYLFSQPPTQQGKHLHQTLQMKA